MHSSRLSSLIIFILSMLCLNNIQSQNLVRNCDFEERNGCPTAQGQINRCRWWSSPGNGSTDYVNACNNGNFGVPSNQWGFQEARSEDGYTHIISYYSTAGTYREYLQSKLACELQAGQDYQVSFFVSCSDNSRFAIDGMAAHFSVGALVQPGVGVIELPGDAHIRNPMGQVLDNKTQWVEIDGIYTAQGGEKFITIGNFHHNGELTVEPFTSWSGNYSSFYIEDVSVEPVDPIFDLGPDTTICPGESITYDIGSICEDAELFWENGSSYPVRTITNPGTYSIEGKLGCTDFYDQITISHPPDPGHFLPSDTIICPDKMVEIIPYGSYESYLWQDGSDAPTFTTDKSGLFWLEVTNTYDCTYRDSINIVDLSEPLFTLGTDTLICLGQEVILNPGIDSMFHHFLWSDYSHSTQLAVSDSGEYWVHISNPCGEMADTINISTYNCNMSVAAPNAFTPNADGLNDVFRIKAENISNFSLYIYDRWGTMVYEGRNLEEGWNGEFKGSPAPAGAYVWLAVFDSGQEDGEQIQHQEKGTVILLR